MMMILMFSFYGYYSSRLSGQKMQTMKMDKPRWFDQAERLISKMGSKLSLLREKTWESSDITTNMIGLLVAAF